MLASSINSPANNSRKLAGSLKLLHRLAASWIVVALVGQWLFALYIIISFAIPILSGQAQESTFSHMITGYVEGDHSGNYTLYAHLLPAAIISLSGIFQLIPIVRKRWPRLHRLNGRVFFVAGLVGALTGLYLTWVRGSRLSDLSAMGITLNGVLILLAIFLAWKFAREKRFALHQIWAVHAFLLVNGVWTFRLYLMAWYFVNQGPNGNSKNLDGPTDIIISYACYFLPMVFAQLYFWAQKQTNKAYIQSANALLVFAVLLTALGILSASLLMWIPRISA